MSDKTPTSAYINECCLLWWLLITPVSWRLHFLDK